MKKTKATILATALTGVMVFILAQCYDLTIDQAVASHVTTIISTLIALFMPPPSGGVAELHVSPRTQKNVPAEEPQVFTEDITK